MVGITQAIVAFIIEYIMFFSLFTYVIIGVIVFLVLKNHEKKNKVNTESVVSNKE